MHKLTIEDDEGKAVAVPLIRDEITIGRQEGNTVRLTERNISRRHARLFKQNGAFWIEDLGSHNGVKLNGARLTASAAVQDGDLVVIGDYRMTLKSERPPATLAYIPPLTLQGSGAPPGVPPVGAGPVAPAAAAVASAAAAAPAAPTTVDAPIDGAPTIPVRTMADQGPMGSRPAAARLVVMSTDLSGTEFQIDRPSLVIGRTPENDIVLNHKSISRHHAKIIRDGDRHVVVDLESANGVRVNGVEFERVELNPGDVLELGHVRIRFTTSADDFDYDPGDVAALSASAKAKRYALGAFGGLIVVAGAVWLLSGDDKKETTAAAPAPVPAVAAKSPAPAREGAALIAAARAAMQQEKWAEALKVVTKAQALSLAPPEAAELRAQIEREQQAATQYEALRAASTANDYHGVLTAFAGIPDASSYKERARPLQTDARDRVVAQHLAKAQRQRAANNCAEAQRDAEAVLALDPANAAAQTIVDGCARAAERLANRAAAREAAAARTTLAARASTPATAAIAPARPAAARVAPRPAARAASRGAESEPPVAAAPLPVPRAAVLGDEGGPGDADALLTEATQYWSRQQFVAAISSARKALKVKPGLTRAYSIIAACSCSLRDKDEAAKAYERLDDRNRQYVKMACQKSGVSLD